MLINGEWRAGKEYFDVKNPYDDSSLDLVPLSSKKDVEDAIESAKNAFATMSNLLKMPLLLCQKCLPIKGQLYFQIPQKL